MTVCMCALTVYLNLTKKKRRVRILFDIAFVFVLFAIIMFARVNW